MRALGRISTFLIIALCAVLFSTPSLASEKICDYPNGAPLSANDTFVFSDCAATQSIKASEIATYILAYDAEVAALRGVTSAADTCFYFSGSGAGGTFSCPSAARTGITNLSGTNTGDQSSVTGNAGTCTATAITDDTTTNATMYLTWVTTTTGNLPQKVSSTKATFNPSTGVVTATGFAGALTGNVTGNCSGSAGSATGNAATATALQNSRNIGGVSFNGTAAIVPQTIESANEASDTSNFVLFFTASGTQQLQPKNNTGFTYNAVTNTVTATTFSGALSGNASTATALQNSRNINGVGFDGTGNITITVPISTGVTGLGTGCATFLATPSSANLIACLTGETGTGNPVFSASPTFTGTILAAAETLSGLLTTQAGLYLNGGYAETDVYDNGNSGTSKAIQMDNGTLQKVAITGAVAMTLPTPTHPGKFTLIANMDGTGHIYSITGCKWAGGSAIAYSTAASKVDIISIIYDGSNFYCSGGVAFN